MRDIQRERKKVLFVCVRETERERFVRDRERKDCERQGDKSLWNIERQREKNCERQRKKRL